MDKLNKTFKVNPLYESDGYKVGHIGMLAPNTTREYWTWIPRNLKYMHPSIKKIMAGGNQMVWRYIHSNFQELFFDQSVEVAEKFGRDMSKYLMMEYNADHFSELHKLGYLPVHIQALPEGTYTNANIPHMAGINTMDGYAWLGLYLETLVSKLSWQLPTTATIGHQFKKNAVEWTKKTNSKDLWLADFLCHDFHSRGGNPFTSIAVGLGHAFTNMGSDTLNVIPASRYYYDFDENEVPVYSVNASEHSVTCTGIFYYKNKLERGLLQDEIENYYSFDVVCEGSVENPDYLAISEYLNLRDWLLKYPEGILSVVSDTFDLWKLITYILPRLKEEILARNGKLVIRPDSGDPVDITCGKSTHAEIIRDDFEDVDGWIEETLIDIVSDETPHGERGTTEKSMLFFHKGEYFIGTIDNIQWNRHDKQYYFIDMWEKANITKKPVDNINEIKGVVELLWDIFGGTTSDEGYKVLDSHIGAIYGDSINLERQIAIYERLEKKGFACTNVVLGIGSYTYVMLTRDSAGYAAKGAWFEIAEDGERNGFNIFKDPITDDGTKKSLKGFQLVTVENGEFVTESEVTEGRAFSDENELVTIYKDGKFFNQYTLEQIREKLNG